ncbi:MAG: M1 family peptidase [Proteobacteria bacterium]|nr:M1 family peptidase [Pseudomonadota bacterium]
MAKARGGPWMIVAAGLALAATSVRAAPNEVLPIEVTAYEVSITPDFQARTIAGEERIRFRPGAGSGQVLRFSPNALQIDSATVDGWPLLVGHTPEATRIALTRPLTPGREATLTIRYHGVPARGLKFGKDAVWTEYFTCDWMICELDRPGEKALITLKLAVPQGMTSLASGAQVSQKGLPGGAKLVTWRETRPYSAYLYGFAIGRFERAKLGKGLTALSAVADEARLKRLFAQTPAMVAFFEDRAGVPLPGRYTSLLVEGDAAQEASSFSILGLEGMKAQEADPHEDWLPAHELAHQWWGNLITCRAWNDLWIDEGLTVFMTAAWKEHRWGRGAFDHEMDLAKRRWDGLKKEAGRDYPLAWDAYPSLRARRAIEYSKGALFFDALRRELGDAVFWAGIKGYTQANAGRAVTGQDLKAAMEKASGRDLSATFRQWGAV